MSTLVTKIQHQQVRNSVEAYFKTCHEPPLPSMALTVTTKGLWISRTTAIEFFQTPAELGERLREPQSVLRAQGEQHLLDAAQVFGSSWGLSAYHAAPTGNDWIYQAQAHQTDGAAQPSAPDSLAPQSGHASLKQASSS